MSAISAVTIQDLPDDLLGVVFQQVGCNPRLREVSHLWQQVFDDNQNTIYGPLLNVEQVQKNWSWSIATFKKYPKGPEFLEEMHKTYGCTLSDERYYKTFRTAQYIDACFRVFCNSISGQYDALKEQKRVERPDAPGCQIIESWRGCDLNPLPLHANAYEEFQSPGVRDKIVRIYACCLDMGIDLQDMHDLFPAEVKLLIQEIPPKAEELCSKEPMLANRRLAPILLMGVVTIAPFPFLAFSFAGPIAGFLTVLLGIVIISLIMGVRILREENTLRESRKV